MPAESSAMTLPLYRAVPVLTAEELARAHCRRSSVRLPSNVPYVVDNLWEHLRPASMPCRRHAIYASPSPALALANASGDDRGQGIGVYRLHISGECRIAQLPWKDARWHPDIRRIQRLVQQFQAGWADAAWDTRQRVAMVFAPGLNKADMEDALAQEPALSTFFEEARALSTFWADAQLEPSCTDGELFIELLGDASYRLQALSRNEADFQPM